MESLFKLKENNTTVGNELIAGCTTFFAMAYIFFVIPNLMIQAGTPDNPIPYGAVFIATVIASAAATLFMALYANVPYALAPGLGLCSFLAFTVCGSMGFTWQEALAMVFLCGIINIIITVTNIRKMIIAAIPIGLQHAIGGGIGIFIAYIGIKNAGLLTFTSDPGTYVQFDSGTVVAGSSAVPALAGLDEAGALLSIIGLAILVALLIRKVRAAILLAIIITALIGIPMGVIDFSSISMEYSLSSSVAQLKETFLAAFGQEGLLSLFKDPVKAPIALMTVLSFSLSDIFDTIGVFVGTSRKAKLFTDEELQAVEKNEPGMKRGKLGRALFADAFGTIIGSIFGTSNVTTYLESTAGIGAGGRTGLTSVVTAGLFVLTAFFAPFIQIIPLQATAPVLIVVGIMMLSSFKEIKWDELSEAIPAFFAGIFMAFCYNISYGIATGFIFYALVMVFKGKAREIKPVMWVCTLLFIGNFALITLL